MSHKCMLSYIYIKENVGLKHTDLLKGGFTRKKVWKIVGGTIKQNEWKMLITYNLRRITQLFQKKISVLFEIESEITFYKTSC
jgi:hypothetical protein